MDKGYFNFLLIKIRIDVLILINNILEWINDNLTL